MKSSITRRIAAGLAVAAFGVGLAGCSSTADKKTETDAANGASSDLVEVVVGASPSPHAKILKHLEDTGAAAEAGITLKIVEFTDYVKPNEALQAKELDANFFQTVPYLESESESRGFEFEAGEGIHLEPLAIYSSNLKSLADVKEGAKIGVIQDVTNQGRALKLLADNDFITLPSGVEASVVNLKADASANPKNFEFLEVDGPMLVRALQDVDIAVINGNFAQEGGLSPADALAVESADNNPSVNVLVWRKGDASEGVKKLDELLHSAKTKSYIEETWADKSVIPAF
ncbi:MAG: MetQ/NlpA family ABC transporter substrate-binding protein [Actinomycetaceae bacterium]|nr:MetQ/NlpA family ABC transporter substrate-binding protein [Actinomycetaceae bacterium]